MLGIYYTNAWKAKSQPFMSTRLRSEDGSAYPVSEVFTGGVLNKEAFATYGVPRLTGTFAYAMFMANAAVSSLSALDVCIYGTSTNFIADWSSGRSLLYVLGWRCRPGLQERSKWPL